MIKTTRFSFLLILGAIFCTTTVFAQQQQMPPQPEPFSPEEVTDEHLEAVVAVSEAAQEIQQEADQEIRDIISNEEGMEFERFQKIMMSQQNPQMAGQIQITEEEKKTIQSLQPQLMQVNQKAQQQYVGAIQDAGMTPQNFQRIALSIQQYPEVAKRFEAMRNESASTEESSGDGN